MLDSGQVNRCESATATGTTADASQDDDGDASTEEPSTSQGLPMAFGISGGMVAAAVTSTSHEQFARTRIHGEAVAHLRTAQGNPAAFAEQIGRGEFAENGAGDAGRIWRAIANSTADEMVDIWGEIMAASTGLWEGQHQAEATTLVETAQQAFPVPEVSVERVEGAIIMARDFQATIAAEEALLHRQ